MAQLPSYSTPSCSTQQTFIIILYPLIAHDRLLRLYQSTQTVPNAAVRSTFSSFVRYIHRNLQSLLI